MQESDSVTLNCAKTHGRNPSKAAILDFIPAEEVGQASRAFSFIYDATALHRNKKEFSP
jgi:hypothetical protein